MAPIPLPRASSLSAVRAVSSSLTPRSITPPSTLFSRAVQATDSSIPSTALAARALTHIKRQSNGIVAIPTTYAGLNKGPAPGTVVGIVLGAVGGTLIVLYFFFTIFNLVGGRRTAVVEEEVIRRRSVSRSPPSTRRRSESRSEVVEVRRPPERRRSERIVVEETTRRSSAPPEDDIVEVIEEHSPPRRHRSKRDSGGYRTVDPAELGGGGRPMRKVRR